MTFTIMLPLLVAVICLAYYLYKTRNWTTAALVVGGAGALVTLFEVAGHVLRF